MFGRRSTDRSVGRSRHHFELREGNAEEDAAAAAAANQGGWPCEMRQMARGKRGMLPACRQAGTKAGA